MRTIAVAAVVLASAALLAAQGPGWQVAFDAADLRSRADVIALGEGLVFGSGKDGALVAVSLVNGEPRWRFQVGTPAASNNVITPGPRGFAGIDDAIAHLIALQSPVWHASLVYVGSRHSKPMDLPNFYAVDGVSGNPRWSFFSPGGVFGPPVPAGDRVIVIGTRLVHALDAATGAERWSFEPLEGLHDEARRPPDGAVVEGESLYLTAWPAHQFNAPHKSYLFALDAANGKRRWTVDVPGNDVTLPVLYGDTVCFGVEEEEADTVSVYAVSKATGVIKWRGRVENASGIAALAARGDALYVSAKGAYSRNQNPIDRVLALDAGTGAVKWSLAGWLLAEPMPSGAPIYGMQRRELAVLDPATGHPQRAIRLNDEGGVVRQADSQLLYCSSRNRLGAYEIATGKERWARRLDSAVATMLLRDGALFVATSGTSLIGYEPKLGRIYRLDAATGKGV